MNKMVKRYMPEKTANNKGGSMKVGQPRIWQILALAIIAASCSVDRNSDKMPRLEDNNILLIVIDTMGADHMGCLVNGLDTTPNIDRLARESVFFKNAYSPAPWTQPAVASLMTGLTPSHHGILRLMNHMAPDLVTLAELVRARGFRTAGVISHFALGNRLGFNQGFEEYDQSCVGPREFICASKVTQNAIQLLERSILMRRICTILTSIAQRSIKATSRRRCFSEIYGIFALH
jgi:hypothetical protein